MKDFLDSIDAILKETNSNKESGLSYLQVSENRSKYGLNTLTKKEADSLWKRIWDASTEPMLLMLIAAGIIALGVNIFRSVTGEGADFLECVGIFIAIALSVAISVVMEDRSAKAFEALSKISKNTLVKVIRDHKTQVINKEDLVVGDIVLLQTGDKITADCRLLESVGLSVDESTLTGESVPAHKEASSTFTDEKTPLAERSNMLYSGTFITSGNCKAIVTAVGDHTEFGVIAKNLHDTDKVVTPTNSSKCITVSISSTVYLDQY